MRKMTHIQWLYDKIVELIYEDLHRTFEIELRCLRGEITVNEMNRLIDNIEPLEIKI